MTIAFTILGVVVIVLAVQDVFHTIFHPAARGNVSDRISRAVWKLFRSALPGGIRLAGPLAFLATLFYWAVSLILGFALIYAPRLPRDVVFAPGILPGTYSSFQGAITVSLCSLMTLSAGVYASALWLQFLFGIEAVLGFALLTASISWILSIYPVLEHKRSLAHQASLLHFSEIRGIRRLDELGDSDLEVLLMSLAAQMTTHRNELTQFPIAYYFYEHNETTALPGVLPYLAEIAERNSQRNGGAGLAATILGGVIDDYLKFVAGVFLHREFTSREQALAALANDQKRRIVHAPSGPRRAA